MIFGGLSNFTEVNRTVILRFLKIRSVVFLSGWLRNIQAIFN